jgi:hypothetical protein
MLANGVRNPMDDLFDGVRESVQPFYMPDRPAA